MPASLAGMLAARTGLSPVMVGRAGIGKTRLVAELVATLDPALPVLAGQGSQGAPGRPFQLLLEAVEPKVAGWDTVPERLAAPGGALLVPVRYQVAEALHGRTGGNPFFLEELLVTAGPADLPLPWRSPAAARTSSSPSSATWWPGT